MINKMNAKLIFNCIQIIIISSIGSINSDSSQTNSQSSVAFKCPDQFGYYADDNNCSKYFVCVFGEALHESCTGGLRFSSELQTCDWPRNVVCLVEDTDTETVKNLETFNPKDNGPNGRPEDDDRSADSLYDYNTEEIRQQIKDNQNDDNIRSVANSFDNLLINKNINNNNNNNEQKNENKFNQNNNNEDFLDLQRSRSVISPQERNYGQQLIGRSVSGFRVSVSSSPSDPAFKDQPLPQNDAQLNEPPKNNRVNGDDLHSPNFDEAIAAIIDENGGIHLNDGPGSLFSLVASDQSSGDDEVSVFVKPVSTEVKQNIRRGLTQNQIVLINRTQLSDPIVNSRANSRYQPSQRQSSRQPQEQYTTIHHQVPAFNFRDNREGIPQQPESGQRSNQRVPRQRIHIIVNNRTQVQEIPIDDQIDFQRIPAIQSPQSVNRYSNPNLRTIDHNRRQSYHNISQPIRTPTTTPAPRRETTERRQQQSRDQNQNDRRQLVNSRTVAPILSDFDIPSDLTSVRRETIPQRPPPIYRTPEPFSTAQACNQKACRLPDCLCAGSDIPAGLPVSQVPQIVLITFDDAVNDINFHIYDEIFQPHRTNPNGCPIRATYYVSHEWTDYGQVQTLYSRGHEMASHSVTHSFGERFSKNQWYKEINGQREILHLYGGVNLEDIRGMRAPFLQGGGNKQFEMLYEANFTYDSTMPIFENNPPFWPFTLDFASNHECMIAPCPTKSFPGFWEIGMVMWQDLRGGRCSMGDACSNPTDEKGVYDMIMKNFMRHYQSNRAPFGLYYHSAWFNTDHHKRGYIRVIDELLKRKDVFFMTKWQAIQWMRNPKPVHELYKSKEWQCPQYKNRPPPCLKPTICNVGSTSGPRFLKTCQPCPHTYPWVGNTGFAKS